MHLNFFKWFTPLRGGAVKIPLTDIFKCVIYKIKEEGG